MNDDYDFEERVMHRQSLQAKGLRFMRYLSTRQMEVWGFFVAGLLLGKIL